METKVNTTSFIDTKEDLIELISMIRADVDSVRVMQTLYLNEIEGKLDKLLITGIESYSGCEDNDDSWTDDLINLIIHVTCLKEEFLSKNIGLSGVSGFSNDNGDERDFGINEDVSNKLIDDFIGTIKIAPLNTRSNPKRVGNRSALRIILDKFIKKNKKR